MKKFETFQNIILCNFRGLLQKNILDKLLKQTTRKFNILSVALSSIHQISKSFNAGDSEDKLRYKHNHAFYVDLGFYLWPHFQALSQGRRFGFLI